MSSIFGTVLSPRWSNPNQPAVDDAPSERNFQQQFTRTSPSPTFEFVTMVDAVKNELAEIEKEISAIKATVRLLGPGDGEGEPNKLSIALLKVGSWRHSMTEQ